MTVDIAPSWPLFAAVSLIPLLLATFVDVALRWRVAEPGPGIQNFHQRVGSWWVMVSIIALAVMAGKTGVVLLAALCSFAALREFMTLTRTQLADHWSLVTLYYVALPLQYYLVWIDWYQLYAILIPVYAFLALPILSAIRGDTTRFLQRIAGMQWALMICVYCLSHLPALMYLEIPGYEGKNIFLIAYLIFVVQLSDVLQYAWGKLCGRRPVAPGVSPSKTVEGLLGGVLSATAVGTLLWWMTPFGVWGAALMALAATVAGFLGGLVMSAIKRDRGVKDWGHLIPGHGGFIDRLDSVLFSAPIFFHLTRYFWSTI